MRKVFALVAVTLLIAGATMAWQTNNSDLNFSPGPGVAVVELFTSEGCSSCPPAEAALNDIVAAADRTNARVFALAFHVDYWNGLGWPDPFSDKAYSHRQREYATHFESTRIYTPQMIVNGSTEFVGSSRMKARAAIADALATKPEAEIEATARHTAGRVMVSVQRPATKTTALINVALVQRGLTTEVPRGENAGRTLHHENVARDFKTQKVSDDEEYHFDLAFPDGAKPADVSLIVYVQDKETWSIVGAKQLSLPTTDK